jgi:tetratricopeptide (TPR) repeat protein/DNA-binding XRE family transcriptional regulator
VFDGDFPVGVAVAEIGPRVHRLRVERGLTQEQLAGGEFTRAYVSAVEVGKRRASFRAARHFAQCLGMSVHDLCFGYEPGGHARLADELTGSRRALSEGLADAAAATLQAVVEQAREHGDLATCAAALCGQARVARARGEPAAALPLYDEALALLSAAPPRLRLDAILGRLGALVETGASGEALSSAQEGLRAESNSPSPDATVRFALSAALIVPLIERRDLTGAAAAAEAALELATSVDDNDVLAHGYHQVNMALITQRRYDEADEVIRRATMLFEHLRLPTEVGLGHQARGHLMLRQARLAEAQTELEQAYELLSSTGARHHLVGVAAELAEVMCRLGELARAGELVRQGRELCAQVSCQPGQLAELDRLDAQLAAARGEHEQAVRLYEGVLESFRATGSLVETATTARLLGDLLRENGRLDEAAQTYRRGLLAVEERA